MDQIDCRPTEHTTGDRADPIRVLTIGDLERASGGPRTTIHAYLRLGLLPRPQKTATNRSLYTEEHVELLAEIAELKRAGMSLREIEAALEERVGESNESTVDLAAQEYTLVHRRILAAAEREIAAKGYRDTHVSTLARMLGITTNVFYEHFPSKHTLLIEVFRAVADWTNRYVASKQAATADPGERALWSTFATFRLHDLGPSALAEVRVERAKNDGELRELVQATWATISQRVESALGEMPSRDGKPAAVPTELIAYSLIGAYEETVSRASWGSKYSREVLLRTHLWVFLAIHAALTGKVDIDSELARYEELIRDLASRTPPVAPFLET
jgi:DNA-binding transcriptional MerR regulator